MKNIIFVLLIFSPLILIAQDLEKLELSVGSSFLYPISDGTNNNYFIGGSAGLGFIISPKVIFSGSITYQSFITNEDSPENMASWLGIAVEIKHVFTSQENTINPYLQLEAGFFIPIGEERNYPIFPELCGSVGVEFLISRNTFLFVDVGYMLGIVTEDIPQLFSSNVGVNFKI